MDLRIGCLLLTATAFFGVTVPAIELRAQAIIAVPDNGTADVGVASKVITNVASNDTVNGAPAVLGASGNATVSKLGSWPTGLVFKNSTGAITTAAALAAGTYGVEYSLCDLATPPDCASATVTINVISPSIDPVADYGTAVAGTASKPIANVAANDTVNGDPAMLGTSGNATVAKVGTWATGLALNTSTGAISTTSAVPAGVYSVGYKLCDKNVPATCASVTDAVTVTSLSIVAEPDSGTAIAGTASTPIANVAANDTVNGVPATLGTTGSATVAQLGSWPTGIALTASTGAVKTISALAPGTYTERYQLCVRKTPSACATGNIAVVVAASIIAQPVAGTAVMGFAVTVIPNVAANDKVNGAPVTLAPTHNATIAQYGNWPAGLSLDTTAGAISTSAVVPSGTYSLEYQLCDLITPADCATAAATITITQSTEVLATSTPLGDLEFDWGRDGIKCPSCNFGDGNARANWTDQNGNIWIAHLDPTSGLFSSPGANDELADTTAFFWDVYGNGPEWAFSTQNGQVISQLVYSRWEPGQPATSSDAGAAFTTQTAYNSVGSNNWAPTFFPGAIGSGNASSGTGNSNLPEASQCNTDPVSLALYKNFATPLQLFTEPLSTAPGTNPAAVPSPSGVTFNGIAERFVPCTHQLLFQATAANDVGTFEQAFWYDIDTQVVEQLTADSTSKAASFMFQAPDLGDNYVFFTLANHTTIQVFEQTGTNADGSPSFVLINSITSPDPNELYMNTPEPFINCTPICTTYIFVTLTDTPSGQDGLAGTNGLAVMAINPATPLFNILIPANALPSRQRLDPEYFISTAGPYLFYNRIVPKSGSAAAYNEGEWFIDMQLGTPSGPCVGSSAQDGLVPGC